jgi:glycosyltransferase involved in cell wall biosynthesis
MARSPGVTIVVATHNRPTMLAVMLNSILASAATVSNPVRIVVVDDASETMEAQAIAKRLRLDYLRLPENRGVAGALAAGFAEVDSPYYALWGDDDAFLVNWFPLHLAKIEEGLDVVAGSYWRSDARLRPVRKHVLPVATLADLRNGDVRCNDGALVRRDALGDITLRPERERAMMMTFWLAMASAGKRFGVVSEPTWLYRRHSTNLSNQRSAHDNELRREAMAEYAA